MSNDLLRRRLMQAAAVTAGGAILGIPMQTLAARAKGGLIVLGTTQKPRHLNSAVQSGIATMSPAAQLFAFPLLMNGKWEARGYLADKYEVSDDARSIRLHLREGATFHDGKPITSEDFQFSFEAVRKHHPFKSMMGPVQAITLDGPQVAVVRLAQPHPALLLAMSTSFMPILPKHIFDDGQDLKSHPRNANPVGSGPFKLVEFKPGRHIIMDRFEDFFIKDQPSIDRLIIKEYRDPSSLLLALEKGEVDVHPQLLDPREIKRAQSNTQVFVERASAPAIGPLNWLAFNTANPKLADKRVRQAINYAIDKKFITETLLAGVHQRATGPIANGSPFHSADVEPYDLNLKKSAALLDEAGLKPDADGKRLALQIDNIPGNAILKSLQEYVKPALAKVGIEVSLRQSPDFPTWAKRISSHDFEMTIDSVWNWGDPVIGVHRTYDSTNIRKGVIWSNTQSYSNPRVDELMSQAGVEADEAKRKLLYAEMQKIVVDDCPVAFLIENTFYSGWNKRLSGPVDSIWGVMAPLSEVSVNS